METAEPVRNGVHRARAIVYTRTYVVTYVRAHMVAEGAGPSTNLRKRAQRTNGG